MFTQKELLVTPRRGSGGEGCCVIWTLSNSKVYEHERDITFPMEIIDDNYLESCFSDWSVFYNIYFPNLVSVGPRGLAYTFGSATIGSGAHVYLPQLRYIGEDGLYRCFADDWGYGTPTVHFRADLSDEARVEAQKCGSYNILYDL